MIQPVNNFHRLLVIEPLNTDKAKLIHVLAIKKLKGVWKSCLLYSNIHLKLN